MPQSNLLDRSSRACELGKCADNRVRMPRCKWIRHSRCTHWPTGLDPTSWNVDCPTGPLARPNCPAGIGDDCDTHVTPADRDDFNRPKHGDKWIRGAIRCAQISTFSFLSKVNCLWLPIPVHRMTHWQSTNSPREKIGRTACKQRLFVICAVFADWDNLIGQLFGRHTRV